MREIKFRAWDKVNNKMQHSGIVWGYSINPKYKDIRFPVLEGFDYGDNIYNLSNIMQYTGLKDKNGVEIYEGDIVVGQFGYKEVVKIEEFNFITREDSCSGYGFILDGCNLDDIKKYVEIIGNIYENPELLAKD